MFSNILLSCVLIVVTAIVHSLATRLAIPVIRRMRDGRRGLQNLKHINIVVLITIFASLMEASLWALVYMRLGAIDVFEEALYFSIVTFTTLGYGDITLGEEFRLLASFEAANGVIIFGWSTAIVVASIQNLISSKFKL